MATLTPVTDGLGYIRYNTVLTVYQRVLSSSIGQVRDAAAGNRDHLFAYYSLAAYAGRRVRSAYWDFAGSGLVGTGDIACFVRTIVKADSDANVYNDPGSATPFATYASANASFAPAFDAAALAALQAAAVAGGSIGLGQLYASGSGTRQLTVGQGAAAAGAPALVVDFFAAARRPLLGVGA